MSDGSYKNIEKVKVGDKVLSYDREIKEYVISEVLETVVHTKENTVYWSEGLYTIRASNGEVMRVTSNHPIFVETEEGWLFRRAENLQEGDVLKLSTPEGPNKTVIEKITYQDKDLEIVYNLKLTKPNNYFAENILVHNGDSLLLPDDEEKSSV